MAESLFERHQPLLQRALEAIRQRGYWSPFPEMPSPKSYGENAAESGKAAFEARLNRPFELDQPGGDGVTGNEVSPYGIPLGVRYPKPNVDRLLAAARQAAVAWRQAGPEAWTGASLEILQRLNRRSFEIAYAVMHTTGQGFMMAFQAGGPHAQDRGVEAVAYAWDEMSRVPRTAYWEKPQGKNEPLRLEKRFEIVPQGIGFVIGCSTFPTWNGYPGLFASLATGNAVVVKPHPGAILPLAITVEVARQALREAGFDPNLVTLVAHEAGDQVAAELALRPEIKLIDFTGSSANGEWLERNARQARVFTEKAGVNQIVLDSTPDLPGALRNLAFSLALYSGQMCTAPQNIYIPADGVATPEGRVGFDQVAAGLNQALDKLLGDAGRAVEVLGAIQNEATLHRLDSARGLGEVLRDSRALEHPQFPQARIRTPLLVKAAAGDEAGFMRELFGPIAFLIPTRDTAHSLELARRGALEHGGLTLGVYSSDDGVLEQAREVAAETGVSLSCNLCGAVYVNQSAAFSDFHGTGANPAANAALTDAAFVAGRFHVVQSRAPVAAPAGAASS